MTMTVSGSGPVQALGILQMNEVYYHDYRHLNCENGNRKIEISNT